MTIPAFSKMVLFGDSDTDGGAGAHGVYTLTEDAWPAAPYVGGRLLLVDVAGFVQEVVANPMAFGFHNTTDACLVDGVVCAEPNRYLFWDGVHFLATFQPLLAEQFYQTILKEA